MTWRRGMTAVLRDLAKGNSSGDTGGHRNVPALSGTDNLGGGVQGFEVAVEEA